jgi:hypothetical protein
MGYADELFEMRVNQHEIKQYKRNMVDSNKFTFQKQQVTSPRNYDAPDEAFDISNELKEILSTSLGAAMNELGVNWEYLDKVERIKVLRRINLILHKEALSQHHGEKPHKEFDPSAIGI